MKKGKLLITSALVYSAIAVKAQFVDPAAAAQQQVQITLQIEQLANSIQMVQNTQQIIQQTKESIGVARQGVKYAQQTAQIMEAIANDRISVEMITDLKMNDLKGLMKDLLCIDIDNFAPKDAINIKILARFKSSLLGCSNNDYYNYTFAGISRKIKDGSFFQYLKRPEDIYRLSKQQINYEMEKIDKALIEAKQQEEFAKTVSAEMTNVSYKYYYNLAEELFDRSKDMYDKLKATTVDADGNTHAAYEMSQFERQQLIMNCIEYQFKAFEYKEKSLAMLEKVSSTKEGADQILKIRSELAARRFNMSVWNPTKN
jgi:hypothetical protein